jgi:hypothetical protein
LQEGKQRAVCPSAMNSRTGATSAPRMQHPIAIASRRDQEATKG